MSIVLEKDKAFINMEDCIRCASCHELCPEEAVRHDGEKVSADIEANVERTKECMAAYVSYFGDVEEGAKCLSGGSSITIE